MAKEVAARLRERLRAAVERWRFRCGRWFGFAHPHDLGRWGEDVAARELVRRGYEILERGFTCRLGELDIVARDGDALVIVEVKTRSRGDYGRAVDAVDYRKRRKLARLAELYLRGRRGRAWARASVRFDVVGVTRVPRGRFRRPEVRIQVVRGAFDAPFATF